MKRVLGFMLILLPTVTQAWVTSMPEGYVRPWYTALLCEATRYGILLPTWVLLMVYLFAQQVLFHYGKRKTGPSKRLLYISAVYAIFVVLDVVVSLKDGFRACGN